MSMTQRNKYAKWAQEDIQKLICLTKTCRTSVIKWEQVAQKLGGRSLQQCKSFYNNFVKVYELDFLLQTVSLKDLAAEAIAFLMAGDSDSFKHIAQQAIYEHTMVDAIQNIQMAAAGNTAFRFNVNLLKLIREIIIAFNQEKASMQEELRSKAAVKFRGKLVTREQFQHFAKMMDAFDADELFLQISFVVSEQLK
ncbi:Myb-like_DNA-binding domain-containing protein [Hexamita inflata]|uniref:Myb-like DNA-binding domain-containing protein n=1 Tax=Hexamita inflata TaxID=28002 RepID=A0AA86PRN9_9EUKA|nr:Myb-like DNA-binding domain-containing protein [Hexamita inflata]